MRKTIVMIAIAAAVGFLWGGFTVMMVEPQDTGQAQAKGRYTTQLSALDYAEIRQLGEKYGLYIDTCSNNGYDYADLYTPDGVFIDNFTEEAYAKGGLKRAQGRDQLAAAAGGGALGCKNVGWKDWSHLMVNHVILPGPNGTATGKVYSVVIGEKGPRDVQRFGGYEDIYVRTPEGWRIQQRTHVRNKAWSNPLLQSKDLN